MAGIPTHYAPLRRKIWTPDYDGIMYTSKRYDERISYTFDIAEDLESGEAISSVSWEHNGPTSQSESDSGSVLTLEITGAGTSEATVTLDSGRILQYKYRFRSEDEAPTDYR